MMNTDIDDMDEISSKRELKLLRLQTSQLNADKDNLLKQIQEIKNKYSLRELLLDKYGRIFRRRVLPGLIISIAASGIIFGIVKIVNYYQSLPTVIQTWETTTEETMKIKEVSTNTSANSQTYSLIDSVGNIWSCNVNTTYNSFTDKPGDYILVKNVSRFERLQYEDGHFSTELQSFRRIAELKTAAVVEN